ncbi:helix-turn-helix domain-containing protein [Mucilaginibacter sp. UR6-1]|uniref:DNA-binding protein n=1 Tax=Mucilaginibacter psychrotolerans TaxID=1524096 RepID=A0A4Y8SFE2_9SPHI|nr:MULTISPECIES: helix-turn-helix domain-containing protein [Mucilaginibacter]MCC8407667.1 helix-turn-helix domain-containing protein [Mucilaginibacter sp. UR6-1]TFF37648.1 DNA-binding protein [Mucilaginibacter psychrotolerans]
MATEIITKEDLQVFKEELLSDIRKIIDRKEQPAGEWLRSSQVRRMLNISPNTLQALRISGKLNYSKVGSIFFYKLEEIRKLVEGDKL